MMKMNPVENKDCGSDWYRVPGGKFIQLKRTLDGRIQAVIREGLDGPSYMADQISGLSREEHQLGRLSTIREDHLIQVVGRSLQFLPKLKGGVFPLILEGAKAFLAKKGIEKLSKEGKATVRVAGQEARATVLEAEGAAKRITEKIGGEARRTLDRALDNTSAALNQLKVESKELIEKSRTESVYVARMASIEVGGLIGKTSKEIGIQLQEAGLESRKSIAALGLEVRNSFLVASDEVNSNIRSASNETSKRLQEARKEIETLLSTAQSSAIETIQAGGDEYQQRSIAIIDQAIDQALQLESRVLSDVTGLIDKTIQDVNRAASGLILEVRDAGTLIVQTLGNELRVTANEALDRWCNKQEVIIDYAGERIELGILKAGQEIRTTLEGFPELAALSGEAFARGFIHGVWDELIGVSRGKQLEHDLKVYFIDRKESKSIFDCLKFVEAQKINPKEKYVLYQVILNFFNNPRFSFTEITQSMVVIGLAALQDESLREKDGYVYKGVDYAQKLLEEMPGDAKKIIKEEGLKALDRWKPQVIEIVEIPGGFQELIELETERVRVLRLELQLEERKRDLEIKKIAAEQNSNNMQDASRQISELTQSNRDLSKQVEDLQRTRDSLIQEVKFLQNKQT
jgi:vacuolar-type H+-ATPase subunit H